MSLLGFPFDLIPPRRSAVTVARLHSDCVPPAHLQNQDDSIESLQNLQHARLLHVLHIEQGSDGVRLEDDLLEPELVRLVGHNEQVLIVNRMVR